MEDEFWQIALLSERKYLNLSEDGSDDDGDSTLDDALSRGDTFSDRDTALHSLSRSSTYRIPWNKCSTHCVELDLSPLPDNGGIWSPLGAEAWFASSLLVAYMLQQTILKDGTKNQSTILSTFLESEFDKFSTASRCTEFTSLELGSGAVGLAGIVLGLILAELDRNDKGENINQEEMTQYRNRIPRIILTDNEPDVVQHLDSNVSNAMTKLRSNSTVPLPNISVQSLDWADYDNAMLLNRGTLQLVIGSELVYTNGTAQACANVVLALLEQNQDILIFIVQVTDRDGWSNVFISTLLKHEQLHVIQEPIRNLDLYDLASSIILPGGTLDRFAFGACYIFNKSSEMASKLASA